MKQLFFTTLLLPLLLLSVICQAESLTTRFLVEHAQLYQSFSIKCALNSLQYTPSGDADTNDYAWATFPPDDQLRRLVVYGRKKNFIESISWRLLFTINPLVAYELILAKGDTASSGKPYSWITAEAFVAVSWLLKSYWNSDSLLFKPMDQLEASQDDSFAITTLMLPGQKQQQSDQQKPPSESSGHQASGTSTRVSGSITSRLSSGSGGGKEDPEQNQHTLDLNCYVGSCCGVCELRQSSDSSEPLVNAFPAEHSTFSAVAKAHEVVSGIIGHMNSLKKILIENDEHYGPKNPNTDIQAFENAIQLLEYLQPWDISKGEDVKFVPDVCGNYDFGINTYYHVYYKGDVLFTVNETVSERRFSTKYSCGQLADIKTSTLFDELYYAPDAPGYQSAKSEFEACAKSTG
ncbi:hypothetical protein [Endozoicomonas sp. ALD040]|uniref:hypothetical protein n=1 Tax=unclassified Endozoicomonas TaxID=2644528 RepID=UPI003BB0E33C